MSAKHRSDFRMRMDDDDRSAVYRSVKEDNKIEKLGQRVTLISILIPCIIVAVIAVLYLNISDRVSQTYSTGTQGVQKLSEDLASSFSALSVKQAKLEDTLNQKVEQIGSAIEKLAAGQKEAQKGLQQVLAAKADKKAVEEDLKQLGQSVSALQDNVQTVTGKISSLRDELKGNIEKNMQSFGADLKELKAFVLSLQNEFATFSSDRIDRKALDEALSKQQGIYDAKIEKAEEQNKLLREKISDLQKSIDTLKKSQAAASQSNRAASAVNRSSKVETSGGQTKTPSPSPEKAPAVSSPPIEGTPKPGTVLEQELKE